MRQTRILTAKAFPRTLLIGGLLLISLFTLNNVKIQNCIAEETINAVMGSLKDKDTGISAILYQSAERSEFYALLLTNLGNSPIEVNYFSDEFNFFSTDAKTYRIQAELENYPDPVINPGVEKYIWFEDFKDRPLDELQSMSVLLGKEKKSIKLVKFSKT